MAEEMEHEWSYQIVLCLNVVNLAKLFSFPAKDILMET